MDNEPQEEPTKVPGPEEKPASRDEQIKEAYQIAGYFERVAKTSLLQRIFYMAGGMVGGSVISPLITDNPVASAITATSIFTAALARTSYNDNKASNHLKACFNRASEKIDEHTMSYLKSLGDEVKDAEPFTLKNAGRIIYDDIRDKPLKGFVMAGVFVLIAPVLLPPIYLMMSGVDSSRSLGITARTARQAKEKIRTNHPSIEP